MENSGDLYEHYAGSFGNKKWISATAVSDYGNSQAIVVASTRRYLKTIRLGAAYVLNRSGSTAVIGLGVRYDVSTWFAGQVTAAGVYTDDTADAQSATTGDFPLHNQADSGSGFVLSANERFNIFSVIQSAAGDQTSPVLLAEYWNGAAWTDLAASLFVADVLDGGGTGEKVLCWPMPFDWVVGGSGTGIEPTRFNLRIRHTHGGAGTTPPVASQVFLGFAKVYLIGITNNNFASLLREHPMTFPISGDALFPLSSVASQKNYVEVDVQFANPMNHP